MFEKVLVPTDFTDEADRVLAYAKGLRMFGLKSITLVHVVDVGRALVWPLPGALTGAIEKKLEERREQLENEGFAAKTVLLEGNPSDEILRVAKDDNFSLIVTGSHGKRLIEEILLGSISESLSRQSQTPVLLIRYDVLKDIEKSQSLPECAANTFKKILFPSDFSEASAEVVPVISKLKSTGAKEIITLHVVDTKKMETEREKREQLDSCWLECGKTARELRAGGFSVQSLCRAGDPLHEILQAAEEMDASLIVMGSHNKGVLKEWLVGSVSLNVIRTIDRPVMVVHGE